MKEHELRNTLRHIRLAGATWHDVYIRLGEAQQHAVSKLTRQAGGLLIAYLLLVSFGDSRTVSVSYSGITASIPSAYVTLYGSIIAFTVIQRFHTVVSIILVRARESTRLRLSRFSANSYGFYHGQDEMALVTPLFLSNYLREKFPTSRILVGLLAVSYLTLLLPIFGAWGFLLKEQIIIVCDQASSLTNTLIAVVGIVVLGFAAIFALLFNLPLPMKKFVWGIRWGVLFQLYPKGTHPRIYDWLDDKNSTPP